jgi:hypothetical protein
MFKYRRTKETNVEAKLGIEEKDVEVEAKTKSEVNIQITTIVDEL